MKTWGCISLLLLGAFYAQGQEKSNEVRNLETFHGVKVGESIDVYLEKGDKESAHVEVKNGNLSDIITEVIDGNLKISLRKGKVKNLFKNIRAKVSVTYVTLKKIRASSSSNVFSLNTIEVPNLSVEISSAASVELSIATNKSFVKVSSAGYAILKGKTKHFNLEASSAGGVDAYQLRSNEVEVQASSAATIKIAVIDELKAKASSGATINYSGDPQKTDVNTSSGGNIKKRG